MSTVSDRTALVTGGARGIGFAIAERLIAGGTRVAVVDIDGVGATDAAARLGKNAVAVNADVTLTDDVERAVDTPFEQWGRLDIVVNNAGITGRSFPIWELTDDDWHRVIACDLTSVFLVCRAAVKRMLAAGGGRIINIASIAGKEGNATLVPYSTAKAGVIGLTKALAKEVATKNIFVNAVAPAVIGTDLLKQMEQSTVDVLVSKIPMGRVGKPEEVAALVGWLASDECSFSTGAVYDRLVSSTASVPVAKTGGSTFPPGSAKTVRSLGRRPGRGLVRGAGQDRGRAERPCVRPAR